MYTLTEPYVVIADPLKTFVPKSAFLVTGCEGSGTTMLTEALRAAGCYWEQDFENIEIEPDFSNKPDNLVIHRSVPHAGKVPDLGHLHNLLRHAGYDVAVLYIIREPHATAKSIKRRDPNRTFYGNYFNSYEGLTRLAMTKIGKMASWTGLFVIITYEAFVTSEGFRRWLFEERLGLPYPEDFHVYNANNAYYPEDK